LTLNTFDYQAFNAGGVATGPVIQLSPSDDIYYEPQLVILSNGDLLSLDNTAVAGGVSWKAYANVYTPSGTLVSSIALPTEWDELSRIGLANRYGVTALANNEYMITGTASSDGGATTYAAEQVFSAVLTGATLITVAASGAAISGGAGDLGVGKVVTLTATFSDAVTVSGGVPTLSLNDGGSAIYTGGSGTNNLTFVYTVATGENAQDLAVTGFAVNAATVQDIAGNNANTSGLVATTGGVVQVDTTAPIVSSITATPAAADLGVGQMATLTMNLSEAVTVTGGVPTLLLNDGGMASYTGGSGTSALTFSYIDAAGQNTTDLAVTGSALNGATILDAAGNAANLAGAVVNPAGTLQIDTTPPQSHFAMVDTTTNTPIATDGAAYTGPVAGIQYDYIAVTSDSLNVTTTTPNWFIHTGSGTDAINVSQGGGTNVLDGSTGSNFLAGGSGNDTFFLDDRGPTADIWSTVVGFHSGDNATIWGVTPSDFALNTSNNQGAAGYTGLTFGFTAPGSPNASLTLAGFSSADLSNGRLSVSYGTTPNLPGLPGSTYMVIHGN
jgi:hypothetical protein